MIKTREQCPWADYIEIDEETLDCFLSPDTPPEIRKLYEEEMEKEKWYREMGIPMPKQRSEKL